MGSAVSVLQRFRTWYSNDEPGQHGSDPSTTLGFTVDTPRPIPIIYQLKPDGKKQFRYSGEVKCGPTSMAMVARAYGRFPELKDVELIEKLSGIARIRSCGIKRESFVMMADELGLAVQIRAGGKDPDWAENNLDWLQKQLEIGNLVVVNGEDHYVVCTGRGDDGSFLINDPASGKTTASPQELTRWVLSHEDGGGLIAVGPRYLGGRVHDRFDRV